MMKMKIVQLSVPSLALAAILAAATPSTIPGQSTTIEFDPAETKVEFTLGATMHTVHGSFAFKRGKISFDPATGQASGEMVVDAASGKSGNEGRDRNMHRVVLESERYPEIIFRPDRLEGTLSPRGRSQVRLHGILQIHGAEHEITVPVDAAIANGLYTVTANFAVPYVSWGMKNPSKLMLRVGDRVDITIETTARARQ